MKKSITSKCQATREDLFSRSAFPDRFRIAKKDSFSSVNTTPLIGTYPPSTPASFQRLVRNLLNFRHGKNDPRVLAGAKPYVLVSAAAHRFSGGFFVSPAIHRRLG